jgi:allantoicase
MSEQEQKYNIQSNSSSNMVATEQILPLRFINQESFKAYGQVYDYQSSDVNVTSANQGTAKRVNHIFKVKNNRPDGVSTLSNPSKKSAEPNVCFFNCVKRDTPNNQFRVHLLERHPYSTQSFYPINSNKDTYYIVLVAPYDSEKDQPDVTKLEAYLANGQQAINYYDNVWHHPMIALNDVSYNINTI